MLITTRSNKHGVFLSVICIVLTIFLPKAASASDHDDILNLATGSKTGVYYPIGQGIAEVAKQSNIKINVLNSEGSVENLNWLEQGKVQLCLAQSDIVYNAYNGLGRFSMKLSNIKIISSLYTEAIHILVRSPLYIKKIEDMRGKRISVGPTGGGTESNARAVLETSGITQNEFKLLNLSFDDGIKAIRENNVDIVFVTSGIPADAVSQMVQDNKSYLFELKSEVLQRLIETYPFFVITTIPAGTYAHQDEEITTIGVSALLLGRGDLNDELVYNLTKSVFTNTKVITQYHQRANSIKLQSALKGVAIPVSNGAILFYRDKGLYRTEMYRKVINYLFIALFIFALAIAVLKFKQIKFFFKTKEVIRILIVLFLIWVLGSFILYFAEHRLNENYSNIFLSLWSGLVNLINFGSKEPFTTTGRTTSVIMMALGVGGIAWLTGEMASIFVHRKLMGVKKKMDKIRDHYVIINWNNKGYGIIEQLLSPDVEKKPIVIISESIESILLPERYEYELVYKIKGNPANEVTLNQANIKDAHSAIILADDKEINIADAKSIIIILTIRKICKGANKQLPIIAEILDPQKVDLAAYAGIEEEGNLEIISSQHLGQNLIAQAAANPGITKVYEDLLTFDVGQEIYKCRVPSKFVGKSFDDLLKGIFELREKDISIIPIAISRGKNVYINPTKKEFNFIEDDDSLFVICKAVKDLNHLNNL